MKFSPFVISSLVFNIGSTIMAAQSEMYFLIYPPVVLLSIFLPAYCPPLHLASKLEHKLGLLPRSEQNDQFEKRSIPRGFFRAVSNFFLVLRGLDDPSVFSILIYPLHFMVNLVAVFLVVNYDFTSSSLDHDNKFQFVSLTIGMGVINLMLMPFLAYKNIIAVLKKCRKCCWSQGSTYVVSGKPTFSDKWLNKESSC